MSVPDTQIHCLLPEDPRLVLIRKLAKSTLNQDRYVFQPYDHALESRILGAFQNGRAVGFLRFLIQVIGEEEGRPPILVDGSPLTEAYVEAFGVDPDFRRQGVGTELQHEVIAYAREKGCYQIRSRSPITSQENYPMKVAMGYTVHPSDANDSYFFMLKL